MNLRPRLALAWLCRIAAIILIGDTLVLLAYLKINLGTLLPGVIGLYLLLPTVFPRLLAHCMQLRAFAIVWRLGQASALALLLGLPAFVFYAKAQQTHTLTATPGAIIVLGAGLRGEEPSPTLRSRLDAAIPLAHQFPATPIVVSGGQGMLETITEADAMRQYLLLARIPDPRILRENQSTSTEENLRFSHMLLSSRGIDIGNQDIVIITSDFHTLRAQALARRAGYASPRMVAAPTPLSIRPNAWLREYLVWLKSWVLDEV